jgi:multisubunit Na+/H+ antiporter MnhB subunit
MKNGWKLTGKIVTAILLCAIGAAAVFAYPGEFAGGRGSIDDYVAIAKQLNIRNLVSTIYLGPRLLDTALEVGVVVLTVLGMIYLRERK